MMTETEILNLKVKIFSTEECLYKLLEELAEAQDAAEALLIDARYSTGVSTQKVKALLEELADVEVAGHRTLKKLFPREAPCYDIKARHGIKVQLRNAIEDRRAAQKKGGI